MLVLPVRTYPAYQYDIVLDNLWYRFSFKWNYRGQYWSLSILDRSDTHIATGVKLVLDRDILAQYRHLAVPQGNIVILDLADGTDKIGYEDFNNERGLLMLYVEDGEEL